MVALIGHVDLRIESRGFLNLKVMDEKLDDDDVGDVGDDVDDDVDACVLGAELQRESEA